MRLGRTRHVLHIMLVQVKVKPWSEDWLIAAGAYPGFCNMKLEAFLLPLDGMLVHRRSTSPLFVRFPRRFASTHVYTWVERGTVRVKCLAQQHNTMSPARARTRTARSGVERTNHEATVPLTMLVHVLVKTGEKTLHLSEMQRNLIVLCTLAKRRNLEGSLVCKLRFC